MTWLAVWLYLTGSAACLALTKDDHPFASPMAWFLLLALWPAIVTVGLLIGVWRKWC
jgi:flavin reductase (DIM6/NTAB) family NADH-FMN oxidoreductase RutF